MRPFSVESGPEALAMVDAAVKSGQPFPLMILDVNMPGMDGFEVAERVSHNPSLHGATIMMLSSASRPGDVSRCKDVGVSAYLMKPVRRGELLEAILEVLGGRVETAKRVRTSKQRSANERRRGISILLAEDNPVNQMVALRLLEKQKHRVQVVGNGHESLRAMEKTGYQGFDLILMDVQMPEMDGLAATAAIRQKEKDLGTGLHIPIVAMTAYAMKGDKERCLAAGMDAYLSKPINTQQLLDIIELLTGSRGETPLQAPPGEAMNKEILDKKAILAAFEGDDELIKEVLGLFLQECPRQMSAIREAVDSHDAERIFRAAHSLKGSLSNFAAAGAFQSAQYLERLGREGELGQSGERPSGFGGASGAAVPGDDGVEQGVRPMKILVADDDPINRRLLEAFLVKNDYEVILARDGQQAWDILRLPDSPQLAILDWSMPGMDGTQICRELRRQTDRGYVYVLLLTSMSREIEMLEGLEAGADDYLTKPFKGPELKARLRTGRRILALQEQLLSANTALHYQLAHDALTGAFSRAAIMEKLRMELTRSRREKTTVGILMADLDRFKEINDTYGHLAGDQILREAAKRMRASVRPYDAVGRCGGEEFLIVMPGCDAASAMNRAEELRKAIGDTPVEIPEEKVSLTISLGVSVGADPDDVELLLRAADNALYEAKNLGRNRVALASREYTIPQHPAPDSETQNADEENTRQMGGSGG